MMGLRLGTYGCTSSDTGHYLWQQVDLSPYYNVIGITSDDFTYPGGGVGYGLDGLRPGTGGNNISGTQLAISASVPFEFENVRYIIPTYADNHTSNVLYCDNQDILFPNGNYDYLNFLGFAVNGHYSGQAFILKYSDGTSIVDVGMSDWFDGTANQGDPDFASETIAIGMDGNLYRIDSDDWSHRGPIYVYRYKLKVDRNRVLQSVSLPGHLEVFVLAMTLLTVVPSPPMMWLSADSLALNPGDPVSSWDDLSGNGNSPTQPDNSLQPVYTGLAVNNKPALAFQASSLSGDAYVAGKYMTCSLGSLSNYSIFVVMRTTDPGFFMVACSLGDGTGYTYWTGYLPDDSGTGFGGHLVPASDSHNDIYASPTDDENWHLCEGIFAGTSLAGWEGGTAATGMPPNGAGNTNGFSGAITNPKFSVGCYGNTSLFWNGYVAEVVLFDRALDDATRKMVESYLKAKYNL